MRSSSLGAFNAQSTYLYTVVKMLSPLRRAVRPLVSVADVNDTTLSNKSQGPKALFRISGLFSYEKGQQKCLLADHILVARFKTLF